jgi:Fe2+ or Zn2+ uptake regulation protein
MTRQTKQRDAILEYVSRSEEHPTAAQVYSEVRKVLPRIGFATVYRNLRVLSEEGQLQELRLGDVTQYDRRTDRHDHVVCRLCGRLADATAALAPGTLAAAADQTGYQIESHHIELIGLCPTCR